MILLIAVMKFKYLTMILTNQNCMHGEIKSRLNVGYACNHLVKKFCFPVCYLWMWKLHITIILCVILYGSETWSRLMKKKEHSLRVFYMWVLRKMFVCKRDAKTGNWRRPHSEEFHDWTPQQTLFRWSNQGNRDEWGPWHVLQKKEIHSRVLREKNWRNETTWKT